MHGGPQRTDAGEQVNPAPAPISGLVLTGGRSTRMGRDKARMVYHGIRQVEWSCQLLRVVCARVLVSARPGQWPAPPFPGCQVLEDRFEGLGPMSGILTAFAAQPAAAWLVLACDLPCLDATTLRALLAGRDPAREATAFDSARDGLPEPLCAIYEPAIRPRLIDLVGQGIHCPRQALLRADVARLRLPNPAALDNVNCPQDHEKARRYLDKRPPD